MAQATLSRYFCQSCRQLSRESSSCRVSFVGPQTRVWTASGINNAQSMQVRSFAFRRPDQQPGLIGRFIQNIKEGMERNKEMQENIKKFQKEAGKFESSETLKTARSRFEFVSKVKDNMSTATEKVSSAAKTMSSGVTAKVSKAYGDLTSSDVFKKGMEASDELSKSAKDAASKVQEQTEEIGKTETFKTVSHGFKVVKEELIDEEIKASRPYQTPAQLRRRTDVNASQPEVKERRIEANEDATGVVLHKESKWYAQWKDFKDNNPVVTGLFSLKMKYDESDNVLVRASRVVTDKVTDMFSDVFSQSEMAKTLSEITKIDPQFNKDKFLQECEFEIIPAVLEAFLQGNLEILHDWCHEPAYNVLAAQIEQTKQLGHKLDAKLLDIRDVDLAMAKIMEHGPVLVLTFTAQQVMALRDAIGNVIEGGEDNIEMVSYVWALCRDQTILDHRMAWRVLEFGIQNSEAYV